MSADNYIYVYRRERGFDACMRFMSCDYDDGAPVGEGRFTTAAEAVAYAHEWEAREVIVEYGVILAPEVVAALSDPVDAATGEGRR